MVIRPVETGQGQGSHTVAGLKSFVGLFNELTNSRCPECDYDLTGLPTDHRCPECALPYPHVCRIYRPARSASRIARSVSIAAVALVLLSLPTQGSAAVKGSGAFLLIGLAILGLILNYLQRDPGYVRLVVSPDGLYEWYRRSERNHIGWADVCSARWSWITGRVLVLDENYTVRMSFSQGLFGAHKKAKVFAIAVNEYAALCRAGS